LLGALERGEQYVRLGDGSVGLLPSEWLKKFGTVAGIGAVNKDGIRFKRPQGAILDAFLDELPEVDVDRQFAQLRERIKSFEGVKPQDPGPGFQGSLRGYQREGLGWLGFLSDFGFGGCLADDMGLGKTIQVLAMLQERHRRRRRGAAKASLVVVPRSLVHNWMSEAQHFCPDLKLLDYSSLDRHAHWD